MPLAQLFPQLSGHNSYQISSPRTGDYNCIAWAALENDRWWWPDQHGIAYWPEAAPREETLDAFVCTFESLGYESCNNSVLESGFEKIAIFTDSNGIPTHMARQLQNGRWTSKVGKLEDIEHDLYALEGVAYGQVAAVLRRAIRAPTR
ncbi:MAG: hypothetical protein HY695_27295 [Deltaproteobacteria bacterium]|nr:hypothetical protein [Deltaproteobacteria bacterium]